MKLKFLFYFLNIFNIFHLLSSSYLSINYKSLNQNYFELENGFVQIKFNSTIGGITSLCSDYNGQGNYGINILTRPFILEIDEGNNNNNYNNYNNNNYNNNNINFEIIKLNDIEAIIQIKGIVNLNSNSNNPIVSEIWEISLNQAQRFFKLSINGKILRDTQVISISHGLYTITSSIYGLFERGVFQMKDNTNSCLGSNETMVKSYFLGNNAALDLTISTNSPSETVFYSSSNIFQTGIQHVIKGNYPRKSLCMEDAWSKLCWKNATLTQLKINDEWLINYEIGVNNMDFPVFPINDATLQPNMPEIDIRTFLTGIYASPPGCLQSYYNLRDGTISPTIATPEYGYSPNTNFFDPDNFISISAMLFSGDKYLTNEVKKIIERTAETMCGIGKDQDLSYCSGASLRKRPLKGTLSPHPLKDELNPRDGQLMHHYINLVPTYESIATSEQLGPNVFWTLSAIRYASVTGDFDWLIKMEPFLSLSAHFLLSFFDEDASMLLVPGPLWIDVLVRENYTSDSNAIVPYVFREFANVFDILHDSGHKYKDSHKTFSDELRRIADAIVEGMNKYLWDENNNDHYITQLNHDKITTRDFIDYDSNLLAIAFDVAPNDKISKILTRVDSGPYTHIRGTWCSEIPYTGDRCDCYIVGGSVCGDSIVTLGRIGWADAIARKKVGDLKTFEDLLLEPLQNDLIKDTWLYERYDSNGNQIRTAYYFEYPSLVAMMLTEIRYGLELNLNNIIINPFQENSGKSSLKYSFSFGTISLEYSQTLIKLKLPGLGYFRDVNIHHLIPSTKYIVTYEGNSSQCSKLSVLQVNSNIDGIIQFTTPIYSDCTIVISSEVM